MRGFRKTPSRKREKGILCMPVDDAEIARRERELAELKERRLQEHGRRYEIVRRLISADEWQRIMDSLTDRDERILFGLEPPEDQGRRRGRPPRVGGGGERPAAPSGELTCLICGKTGLTKRGLALHMSRMHKGEQAAAGQEEEGA
jgi:hypothetical protein